jgi:hypothetical protein
MAVVLGLQRMVERLHGVAIGESVTEYLVDKSLLHTIPGARQDVPEQLFVREEADGLAIALYIDAQIITTLERDNPLRHLYRGNLEAFAIAVEGVSHFVLLAYRAQREWPVTQLELEMQAEVDKFVSAWLLLAVQGQPLVQTAQPLLACFFDFYQLRETLSPGERERYDAASRAAARYCVHLVHVYERDHTSQRIAEDVRAFSRRGLADKLRAA